MTWESSVEGLLEWGDWRMSPGERAALAGLLASRRPALSIEIGTWSGGSLAPIAEWSSEVHAFDLVRHPTLAPDRFPNVVFHTGDSHELLPRFLGHLADEGRAVDFVLVDGDHSAEGIRADLENLLSSPCVRSTVIVLHDTLNVSVRTGLERVHIGDREHVCFCDLDFVPGRVPREGPLVDRYWSGLGLVVTGENGPGEWPGWYSMLDVFEAFSRARLESGVSAELIGRLQVLELEEELERQRRLNRLMEKSLSWRLTAPLRRGKSFLRGRRRPRAFVHRTR